MEMDVEGVDQISSLPDALLSRIISHLGISESIRTSILSRRWKNIWKSSSCLHFDTNFLTKSRIDIYERGASFRNYDRKRLYDEISRATGLVERVIDSHETKLVFCSISHIEDNLKSGLVERLIKNLKEKKLIEELSLVCEKLFVSDRFQCNLPPGIFFCRTLHVLELKGYRLKDASPFESCRNLVTLRLDSVNLDDKTLSRVILNCMFLEDLCLCSCTGLKKIEIHDKKLKSLKLNDLDLEGVDIEAEGLSILVLNSVSCSVNMKINTPTLVEFGFCSDGTGRLQKSTQIYSRIIDILERCCGLLQQKPNNGFVNCSNPFGQLHTLSISLALDSQMEQHILDHIFRLCTHLQKLCISIPPNNTGPSDWELPYPTFMFWEKRELHDSITHSLKLVKIKGFCGKEEEIVFAKHLIRKAPMLRRFVVECGENCSETGARETLGLSLEPRASVNLSIVLKPEVDGSFQNWVSTLNQNPSC
uniref:F-box domain-containing protein n=1 Tax=Populus alba TaxID=43335 RepID=A0A4U5P7J0_POPAL|nr:hypothetical protein D5086_0000220210 [Populus alba]